MLNRRINLAEKLQKIMSRTPKKQTESTAISADLLSKAPEKALSAAKQEKIWGFSDQFRSSHPGNRSKISHKCTCGAKINTVLQKQSNENKRNSKDNDNYKPRDTNILPKIQSNCIKSFAVFSAQPSSNIFSKIIRQCACSSDTVNENPESNYI